MEDPTIGPRRASRRKRLARLFAAVALTGSVAWAVGVSTPSAATEVAGVFELDGNPQQSTAPGDDWETLLTGGTAIAKTAIPIFDGADSPTDTTYFTGGGSKDVRNITDWRHSTTDVAPDKNEIVNAAAAAYRVNGDLVIAFHADRFSNDGDAAAGFWFFKQSVSLKADGTFSGTHSNGDLFIASDFNEGEGINTIRVFQWSNGALVEAVLPGSGPVDCQDDNHNPYICATENRTNQDDVASVWPYKPKANIGVRNKYPDFTFLEGAINISQVVPNSDQCFASFLSESRSSTIPNAQLKDFVLGDFPICAPSTQLTASPNTTTPEVAVVGDQVTFNFTEANNGNVTLTNVHVTTNNTACNTAMTPTSVTLLAGTSQVFSCTITTSGTPAVIDIVATGHGNDPIGRDTTFCANPATPPANTVCDQEERATGRAVTILPGSELSSSVNPSTVKEGDTVTFTITEANDGDAPAGYESFLGLTNNTVTATGSPQSAADDCNAELASPISGDTDTDGVLDAGETWTFVCTVTAPAGSFSLQFDGSGTALAGTSHQVTVDFAFDSEERGSSDVTVINPSTILTIRTSAVVTYTFVEANDTTTATADLVPPTPGVRESVLSLENGSAPCDVSPIAYVSGDTDNDFILDDGEAWTFTCQGSLAGPAGDGDPTVASSSSTLTGIGHGTDPTGDDVTFPDDPDERDRVEVIIRHRPRGAG